MGMHSINPLQEKTPKSAPCEIHNPGAPGLQAESRIQTKDNNMKNITSAVLIGLLLVSPGAFARDTVQAFSIEEALSSEKAKAALGEEAAFFFGDQSPGAVVKEFGEIKTNRKTNAFGKSDKEACQWVFLSAMIALRDRALADGGNAVINIKSNYKNNLTSSESTFQCGAGAIMAGVALVGTVVKIEE
jgi:uncharacterized protein YbjQ (UPF0145 family)